MKPIFSIIVPAYNVAAYLPAALDSVQAQDVAAWECLCVDDGSTDGTAEVLQRYAATDARFRLFRQENAGVSVARNRALQEVKGEWILFLDGDDLLAPGLLSALQRATDTTPPHLPPCDMVAFGNRNFPQDETPAWPPQRDTCRYYETHRGLPGEVIWTQFWAWAYRAELAKRHRFVEALAVGEDRLYAFQCVLQTRAVGYLFDFCGHGYRVRQSGVSFSAWTVKKYQDNLFFFRETLHLFAPQPRCLARPFQMSFIGYILYRYQDTWHLADAPGRFYWPGWRAHWHLSLQRGIPLWGRIGLWGSLLMPTPKLVSFFTGHLWGRLAFCSRERLKAALFRRLPARLRASH